MSTDTLVPTAVGGQSAELENRRILTLTSAHDRRMSAKPELPAVEWNRGLFGNLQERDVSLDHDSGRLAPYVPRLVVDWLRNSPHETVREVDGTLAFLDISGFTRLTERLARRGKEGAEEMSEILNKTFASLLDVGYQDGAGLVKWGGDAVLLLFDGPEHTTRAARAAFRMRAALRSIGRLQTSAGAVVLRMSAGIHSGTFHFFLVGDPAHHRELLVAGPAASLTAEIEAVAGAGEIALSADAAAQLPERCVGATRERARLLRAEPDIKAFGVPPAKSVEGLRLADVLPREIREHLLAQFGDAEHRTISVGFVEFSGTDELLRAEGPSTLASALSDVIANIQRATEHFGVTFFETDISRNGGKVMLTAGAPVSHGHDEDRMLRAARQIIEHQGRLSLRIGLNRGAVFAGDFGPPFRRTYSVKGDAINLAARVMAKAGPGQVLATREVIDRSRTEFEVTEVPPFQVKGKTRAIDACLVGSAAGRHHATVDQTVIRSREPELQRLRDQIALASSGRGSVTLIDGERGSGRSRVVAELPSLAGDINLVRVSCDEYESTTPYVALRRLFRRAMRLRDESDDEQVLQALNRVTERGDGTLTPWLPLLGIVLGVAIAETPESSELDDEFRKARMEAAAVELLALTLPGPAVLVVDDVHNLDEASHGILAGILDAARQRRPWSVVLTLRTGTETPWSAEAGSSDLPTLHLHLGPLSETQAIELVTAETEDRPLPPATIESIVRRSGGNPLFLHSLLSFARSGQDLQGLPETIEDLVTVEIDRLAPTERRILRFASVLGTRVDADLLARMLGDEWVSPRSPRFRPLMSFLVPTQAGQLQFRNSLYRDVAYQALPFGRRRDLHEQAGAALLARAGDQGAQEAELLAWHFHLADRSAETWRYGRLAAEQAQAQFAQSEAATFLAWAVRAGRRCGASAIELAQVLESLGDTQFLLGLSSDARRSYRDAVRVATDDPIRGAGLQLKLARLDQRIGHLPQSLRRLTRGMRLVKDMDEPRAEAIEAELATRYAIGRFQQGRYRDAKQWGDRAVAIAERSRDREVLANAHNALEAITLWAGLTSAIAHGQVALSLYEDIDDLAGQGHSLNNLAIRAIFEGRWDDTQPLLTRAAALFEQIGDVSSLAAALYNQADVLVRQGRSAAAEPLLQRSLRIARSVDDDETAALVLRDWGKATARAGEFERAQSLLNEAIAMLEDLGEPQELLDAEAALAECALLRGDPVDALHLVDGALKRGHADNASVLPTLHRVRGFSYLVLGDVEAAGAAFDAGLQLQEPAARHEMAFLTVGRAEVAHRLGQPDARALSDQGAATLRTLGVETPPFPAGAVLH